MMCAIFAFTSCEQPNAENNELPVDGVELPDATTTTTRSHMSKTEIYSVNDNYESGAKIIEVGY